MKQYYASKPCQYCKSLFEPYSPTHRYCSPQCSFYDKIEMDCPCDCWIWTSAKTGGYGWFKSAKIVFRAHRFMWEQIHGEIPEGMCVLHKCDNPGCVNPAHLFLGFPSDNVKDCISKGRFRSHQGENNVRAKLTENDVVGIKQLLSTGILQKDIASLYNISGVTISHINTSRTWPHV